MRHISKCVAVSKLEPTNGEPCLFVDLDGPGGASSNVIKIAVSLDVARQIGEAAQPRPEQQPLHVMQDGAQFYLFDPFENLIASVIINMTVKDLDVPAAMRAREQFKALMTGRKLVWG